MAEKPGPLSYPRRYGWILVRTETNHIEEFSFFKPEIQQALKYHPEREQLHIERGRVASMVRREPYVDPNAEKTT